MLRQCRAAPAVQWSERFMLKLSGYLKPYRLGVAAALVLILLQTLAELYLPTLLADIVDQGIVRGVPVIPESAGCCRLGSRHSHPISCLPRHHGSGFSQDLRSQVFAKVQSFSLPEFDQFGTASLITRTTNDITQVQMVLMMLIRMMAMAPLMCIGGVIMAVSKDPALSLLLLSIPVLGGAILLVARKGLPLFSAIQVKLDRINLLIRETLSGIRVIRAFNRSGHEQRRFGDANNDFATTAIRVNRIMASLMPFLMLVMNLTTVALVWFGAIRIGGGHMQVTT